MMELTKDTAVPQALSRLHCEVARIAGANPTEIGHVSELKTAFKLGRAK
jgi:hypothetical protein